MSDNAARYAFPETLNEQKRILGLPPEEFVVLFSCGLAGFFYDMLLAMFVTGLGLWLLIRYMKKGQGSWWLINVCYWYLPTSLFRFQFRRVPDSSKRHWMK